MRKGLKMRVLACLILGLMVVSINAGDNWQNDWDEDHSHVCGKSEDASRVKSIHDNYNEDRKWEWQCRKTPLLEKGESCKWHNDVNDYDEIMNFECPNSQVIAGSKSTHSNWWQDRKFSYICCSGSPKNAVSCSKTNCYTTKYINDWDQRMDYSVKTGEHLVGFYSEENSYRQDRIFKAKICSMKCNCKPGFTGTYCETEIDECKQSKPCQNGAGCVDLVNDFQCNCLPGFEGKNCDVDIDECKTNPCKNGAACADLINDYHCECPAGFDGKNCEINIDDCADKPCLNGGACHDLVDDYSCTCKPGFEGKDCVININECEPNPCANDGKCLDQINGFECVCRSFFEGAKCEEKNFGIASSNVMECGVGPNLAKTNGTFVSKGVNVNTTTGYTNDFTCGLKISAPEGQKVHLQGQFDIEESIDCLYDNIKIFDGQNSTRLCGDGDIDWTSSSSDIKIKFNSDESKFGKGFVINFSFV